MPTVSGLIYLDGDFVEGFIHFENGRIVDKGDGLEPDAEISGIILPSAVNCHTHLGDSAVPRPPPGTVEEIVGPPDGYKHRMLRELSDEQLEAGISRSLKAMAAGGISHTIDFREGGVPGAAGMLRASGGSGVRPLIMGRPGQMEYDPDEVSRLLEVADGIGLSSISDYERGCVECMADDVRGSGKSLALHASERAREDIELILGLEPAFLVHMTEADDSDLLACADAGVPVVVCPRANSFFGIRPPVERILKAGARLCLGTDNAMLASPDILAEMSFLRGLVSPSDMSDRRLVGAVFDDGRKVLNEILECGDEARGQEGFTVLDRPFDDPFSQVVRSSEKDVRFVWRPGI